MSLPSRKPHGRVLRWLARGAHVALLLAPSGALADNPLARFEFSERHLGTTVRVVLYAKDDEIANLAARGAFARVKELDNRLSDYQPESELSRLSAASPTQKPVPLGKDLWTVLAAADRLAAETDGAFDVTVGPLTELWRRARRERTLPSPQELAAARERVGRRHMLLDADAKTARLLAANMRLDLGGIAKGYVADEALAVLRAAGIDSAMVAASGDLALGDAPPDADGWRIGVAPLSGERAKPSRVLTLRRCGVSTSGDAFQFVEIGGRRYSHIVDPRTGVGLTRRASVTVIAPDGMTADSLATALSVMGSASGLDFLARRYPKAAAWLVEVGEDGTERVAQSASWPE